MFYQTTTIDIYRFTDDPELVNRDATTETLVAKDVPASLIQQASTIQQSSLFHSDVDRIYPTDLVAGRVDTHVDVQVSDVIQDKFTGIRYSVAGVVVIDTFVARTKRLILRAS
jgi:hypothetical protein